MCIGVFGGVKRGASAARVLGGGEEDEVQVGVLGGGIWRGGSVDQDGVWTCVWG